MSEGMKKVYHYTDQKGKEAIEQSRVIKASSGGIDGSGVYLTSMPPTEGRKAVSENNWDGGSNTRESNGRADHVFELEIPESKLRKAKEAKDRDVLVHDGSVKLDDYKWKHMSK